jgi:hypothetical protein
MPQKFFVPKYITIEDRLEGLITIRQLFALLIAFFISYFSFKIHTYIGIPAAILSFGIAVLGTFWQVNGKPFLNVLPSAIKSLMNQEKYIWKRIERTAYKEIEVPEAEEKEYYPEFIEPRRKKLTELPKTLEVEVSAPEIVSSFKEKVKVELDKPLALQKEEFKKLGHSHEINPHNPYRLFPYIKFTQKTKI